MDDEAKLMLLRAQLYSAMQTLKGDALTEFWELINEIKGSEFLFPGTGKP